MTLTMSEVMEVNNMSCPNSPNDSKLSDHKKTPPSSSPPISAPPFQLHHSPSLARSPLLDSAPRTPRSPFVARVITPVASPMKKAISSVQGCLEEVGHFSKLDPQDDWLPITESRNGNMYYSAFHTLCSGIGVQALVLPLAFTVLGWIWGSLCLSLVFTWQLYTLWLLIQMHESESGTRFSRYLRLSMVAFGEKLGKLLALFPIMYLSGGTCVTLIIIGGGTMKIFFQIVCGDKCSISPPSTVEWYLVFTCCAIIIAQLPNLNSIAGVSLAGAVTAITYCTLIWVLSVTKDRPMGVSYEPLGAKSQMARICSILNAIGIVAFAFRGHNLVLEIQRIVVEVFMILVIPITDHYGENFTTKLKDRVAWYEEDKGTMPSCRQKPSHKPMWKGVKFAYLMIAMCLFPLALGGYWAYGNLIPTTEGMLNALYKYHKHDTAKAILGLVSLLVVINSLSSFQIYAMPVFDNLEFRYTYNKNKPCPRWVRTGFRILFGCLAFFISVAVPFLPSLAGLIGGIALPITLAYPCLMWILIKQPARYSAMWCINGVLGMWGIILSILITAGAIWSIVTIGIEVNFFNPH